MFTDYYGQQSCTAGRAAFITGQSPMRTGLLKVGLPGAKEGLSEKDPTIAELLKPQGYATGQFGKNHLGDRNAFLRTVHGFDEFFGNLYHLNARRARASGLSKTRASGRNSAPWRRECVATDRPRGMTSLVRGARNAKKQARLQRSAWRRSI
jgi:arylsulfatase A-like enzyme